MYENSQAKRPSGVSGKWATLEITSIINAKLCCLFATMGQSNSPQNIHVHSDYVTN